MTDFSIVLWPFGHISLHFSAFSCKQCIFKTTYELKTDHYTVSIPMCTIELDSIALLLAVLMQVVHCVCTPPSVIASHLCFSGLRTMSVICV